MSKTTRFAENRPTGRHRVAARLVVAALFVMAAVTIGHSQQGAGTVDLGQNFDIRIDRQGGSEAYLQRFAAPPAAAGAFSGARAAAVAELEANLGAVDLIDNRELDTLEVVSARPGARFLTEPSNDRAGALRGFLSAYAGAYGLSQAQVGSLALLADYMNPAGNMGWVEFEQQINGLPVFRGLIRGGFTASGELARTTGPLAAGLDAGSLRTAPIVSAAQAVSRAASHVGWNVPESALAPTAAGTDGRVTFARGPMTDEASAWLLYFPLAPGVARLAWATEVWGDPEAFLILLDAEDGTILFRKNLTNYQAQPATYTIYNNDSPAPMSPSTVLPGSGTQAPFIARSTITRIGNEAPNTFDNLGWITDGTNITDGNNVQAGIDRDGVDGVDAPVSGSPSRVFTFACNPAVDEPLTTACQNAEVTDAFYWVNVYHDRLYALGFTEAARNFQNNNFGRGGLGADRIRAEEQDSSNVNNANFSTGPDGTRGRMQMYVFPGPVPDRTSGLEHDVLLHELTHGTSNRLHGNATGLASAMSVGMGEGWSDFYARALLSGPDEDVNAVYSVGGWVTNLLVSGYTDNYFYGIRRFPYAVKSTVGSNGKPINPLTFADIDPTQIATVDGAFPRSPVIPNTASEVHNVGEVWCMALLEVRARFITRLGFATGNQRILQFVTDGMKLDPVNPTLLQGRDSIIAAANAGGGTVADIADIWAGFATRGMGAFAAVSNAATFAVTENFNGPGDPIPPIAVTGPAVNVRRTTATLTGNANPSGSDTTAFFEYGATTTYGRTTPVQHLGSGIVPVAIGGGELSGLICNRVYHYRVKATSDVGTSDGADATFATTCNIGGDFDAQDYVVSNTTDSVVISDAFSLTPVATVPLPPAAQNYDVAVTPNQSLAFVVRNNDIWTIDLTQHPPALVIGNNPIVNPLNTIIEDLALTADGRFLLVSDGSNPGAPIAVVNTATRAVVGTFTPLADHNSVEVCDNGSVLVTSFSTKVVRRLTISAAGSLIDTGQTLALGLTALDGPNNTACAPGGATAVVVNRLTGDLRSFRVDGMTLVSTQVLPGTGLGINVSISDDGAKLFGRRSADFVTAYDFNPNTGAIGSQLWSTNVGPRNTYYGVDQMALHPNGTRLFATADSVVWALNTTTGTPVGTIPVANTVGIGLRRSARAATDFDGDGKADLTVWRPGNGTWYSLTSLNGYNYASSSATQWGSGAEHDQPLVGDIDGDGQADLIVWRPATGTWYWLTSSNGYQYGGAGSKQWGSHDAGDIPLIGDVDGDGKADLIVWRAATGTWYWLTSSTNYDYATAGSKQWGNGEAGDVPLLGDVDGDGKADLIVWRATTGTWYWLPSSSRYNYANGGSKQFGSAADTPLLGDLDGDRKADLFVWQPMDGMFRWVTSSTGYNDGAAGSKQWGSNANGDIPLLGNVDGDGEADLIVWRPTDGTFYWLKSSSGYDYAAAAGKQWGTADDIPLIR